MKEERTLPYHYSTISQPNLALLILILGHIWKLYNRILNVDFIAFRKSAPARRARGENGKAENPAPVRLFRNRPAILAPAGRDSQPALPVARGHFAATPRLALQARGSRRRGPRRFPGGLPLPRRQESEDARSRPDTGRGRYP